MGKLLARHIIYKGTNGDEELGMGMVEIVSEADAGLIKDAGRIKLGADGRPAVEPFERETHSTTYHSGTLAIYPDGRYELEP